MKDQERGLQLQLYEDNLVRLSEQLSGNYEQLMNSFYFITRTHKTLGLKAKSKSSLVVPTVSGDSVERFCNMKSSTDRKSTERARIDWILIEGFLQRLV